MIDKERQLHKVQDPSGNALMMKGNRVFAKSMYLAETEVSEGLLFSSSCISCELWRLATGK